MNTLSRNLVAMTALATFVGGGLLSGPIMPTKAAEGIITNKKVGLASSGVFADSTQATPGDEVEFRIFLQNDTGSNGARPQIIDTLDSRLSYVPGSSMIRIKENNEDKDETLKDSNIKFEGQKITWQFTDMDSRPDQALYLHFMAKVADGSQFPVGQTPITNCAISTLNTGALSKETNCVQAVVNKLANPTVSFDLRSEVTNRTLGDSKWYVNQLASAKPGDKVSFRLSLVNTGNTPAQNVTLKDILPANVSFAGNMKIYDVDNKDGVAVSGDAIAKNGYVISTLNSGNTNYKQIVFDATVTGSCGDAQVLTNKAQVVYGNKVTAESTIGLISSCTRGLIIVKDVLNPVTNQFQDKIGTVKGNSTLTYRINVLNNGTSNISNPTVRDVLPAGSVYVKNSMKIDGEVMSQATQDYFLSSGVILTDLSPGLGKDITIQVQVQCVQGNTAQKLVNTAYVKANGSEISDTAEATIEACNTPTSTPKPPVKTPPTELPKSGPEAGIALAGALSSIGAGASRFYYLKNKLKKSLGNIHVL